MTILATTVLVLGAQLVLGVGALVAGSSVVARVASRGGRSNRRWLVAWAEARRALLPTLPFAVALGLAGLGWHLLVGLRPGRLAVWASPVAFVLLGGVPTAGCFLLLRAGSLEARSRIRAARRQVRLGGLLVLAGTFSQLVLLWVDLLYRPRFRIAVVRDVPGAAILLAVAMLSLGFAAFVAVLAGLSGKPRPSGVFAALLYVAGLAAVVGATQAVVGHVGAIGGQAPRAVVAPSVIYPGPGSGPRRPMHPRPAVAFVKNAG